MKKSIIFVLIFAISVLFITAQNKTTLQSLQKKTTETEQKQIKPGKTTLNEISKTTKTAEVTKNTSKKNTTAKMFKGYVVSLAGVMQGNYHLSKAEAVKLANVGSSIVLIDSKSKSGKIYFLVGQGGESLNKKLAKYAVYKKVAVSGWFKFVNRTRFIIVDFIESAE
jgi:hypothetical protein